MDFKRVRILLSIFTIACILLTLYIYSQVISNDAFIAILNNDIKFWNNPFREVLYDLNYVELHPTYYSLWIYFSALFLIEDTFRQKKTYKVVLKTILVIFLISTALLFSSRGPLIGFFLAFIIILLSHIRTLKKKLFFLALVFTVLSVTISQMSFLKSRFIDEFTAQEFRPPVGNAHTSTNIRVGIYTCVLQIFNDNKLIGVGIGDVQEELDECYQQFHTRVYEESNYNTHSSYFNILLATGIVGLIIFLTVFIYQFKLAFSSKNKLYLAFLILVAVAMLFENILIRMHGAVFFALFNSIFVKNLFVNESILNREKI
jgi:O-antigen ligase